MRRLTEESRVTEVGAASERHHKRLGDTATRRQRWLTKASPCLPRSLSPCLCSSASARGPTRSPVATVATMPTVEQATSPTVRTCYDLLDIVPALRRDRSHRRQVSRRPQRPGRVSGRTGAAGRVLAGSGAYANAGTRLLDIGCGYGRILEHAARRGAANRYYHLAAASGAVSRTRT